MIEEGELQRKIENNEPAGNSADAKAYQKVFDVLNKDIYSLPEGFADLVILRIEARNSFAKDYLWMGIGLLCLLIAGLVTSTLLNFKLNFGSFKFISGYAGLITFGIFFIIVFQWVDKKMVPKKFL
jgi:hypothetical protein